MVVEVHLYDVIFILLDDALNFGDLLGRVEDVNVGEVLPSSLASLTIKEHETNCCIFIPLNLCDGQISEFLETFIANFGEAWKHLSADHICILPDNVLAFDDRLDHQIL